MRQDHPMTPGVIDARQQNEPNHPGRRADDADHSEQTLDMVQTDIINRLRIKAGMIQMGERIEWGSDSDLMYEAADMIEQLMARDEQYTPADMADQGAQGWRDGYRHAKGEACPEGYVMVPVEPTPEMLAATSWPNCAATDYAHMLSAAPAVQREPVAYLFPDEAGRTKIVLGKETAEHWCPPDASITPLYAAPQPAPDVSALVEALEEIIDPIRFMEERLEEGERLNGMAAVQLAGDASYLRCIARAVLAAHQQRETSHE